MSMLLLGLKMHLRLYVETMLSECKYLATVPVHVGYKFPELPNSAL